ncbi:MAG TPA: fluoride efflux transporter CrcB [Paracoccaceae bacterium]|nr:fluoride efflux transporter CrcB [Paracoccaceae bacterium]HMO72522.1 fluoride efflux transporter CrcB [Paracoccaceae bacterium]
MTPAILFQVALGGAIGSVGRYVMTWGIARACLPGFPLGTVAVNVTGSFAMGILFVILGREGRVSPFLLTGVLGGFTTFSAFSLDAFCLWERGDHAQAALYVGSSVILSVAALVAGIALARGIA